MKKSAGIVMVSTILLALLGGSTASAEHNAAGESYAVPERTQLLKFTGDVRIRYQWDDTEGGIERHRGRYRLRLNSTVAPANGVRVGFGLVTGGTDPRAANQTMQNTFETPDVRLNYAFLEYTASPWLSLYGGKFSCKPALWQPDDLLWDSDIHPEGVSVCISGAVSSNIDAFTNMSMWILDESSNDPSDPMMYVVQSGLAWKIRSTASIRAAVAYYAFSNVWRGRLDHSAQTNTLDEHENLVYKYDTLNPSLELAMDNFSDGPVSYLALSGNYIRNSDPGENNCGYLIKVSLGTPKVKEGGQWQARYLYRYLERDAWLDTFPDSDVYGGGTNATGHEAILEIGLAKNLSLGLDYYSNERIEGDKQSQRVLQVDVRAEF